MPFLWCELGLINLWFYISINTLIIVNDNELIIYVLVAVSCKICINEAL